MQEFPHAVRHERVRKALADEDDGLSREIVAQVVARVENTFAFTNSARRMDRETAEVRVAVVRCREQKCQAYDAVGEQGQHEDKRNIDVEVHRAETAQKAGGANKQRNGEH